MTRLLLNVIAFARGVYEFRRDWTWADPARDDSNVYTGRDELYDMGRELAHKLTFRRFDC